MQYPNKTKILRPIPSLVLTSIMLTTAVSPSWAFGGPWKPRQTLNLQGGHGFQDYYDALLPLSGDAERMFYANGSLAGNHHTTGGDLGLGYRQIILNNEYVVGGFALMGRYQTNYHNMFTQLTLGSELFGTVWEGRAHFYQPVSKKTKFVSTHTEAVQFQGHKLFALQSITYEHAEGGADVEIGRVIPWIPQLRGFAGYYHNGLGADHKNIDGGYGRFEYRYNNHFIFTLSDSYDSYQGNFFSIGVRMSIGSPEGKEPLTATQRMTDYSVRRRDVFTYTNKYYNNFVASENFYFVTGQSTSGDGSIESPFTTIPEAVAAAGANGGPNVVYVCNCNNSAGYTYDLGGQLNLGPNTKIIGSGGSFTLNNVVIPSLCGTTRPTLVGGLYLPGSNEVSNFNITGNGTTQNAAIVGTGSNISLNNLNIYGYKGTNGVDGINGADGANPGDSGGSGTDATAGSSAYGILITNSSNVLINQVNVSNITGGNGGVGGTGGNSSGNGGNGGDGGAGGSGGDALGILITNSNQVSLNQITVSDLQGGLGNAGGLGGNSLGFIQSSPYIPGLGGNGGSGGNGGNVTGIAFDPISSLSMNSININGNFNAGAAGVGGNGGAGGLGQGGNLGFGGPGGNGQAGGAGGNGGAGGSGGNAAGITFNTVSSLSLNSINISGSYNGGAAAVGGDGGTGGTGGSGGDSDFFGGFGDPAGAGAIGGAGGIGGNGGNGGNVTGIIFNSVSSLSLNSVNLSGSFNAGASAIGGTGGTGGTGGGGGNGLNGGRGGNGGDGGTGGNGGTGGAGGNAYGIQSGGLGSLNVAYNETLTASAGSSGGSAGGGGTGGSHGTGNPNGTDGNLGGSGTDGNPGPDGTTGNIEP